MPELKRAISPTSEMSVILGALNALKRGDLAVRLPQDWMGVSGRVADVFNEVVERNERMAQELSRLSRIVGKEGKLGKRGSLGEVTGFWRDSIDSVNVLIDDLVHPTSETARVIGAVAQGDLSQTMALEVRAARCGASRGEGSPSSSRSPDGGRPRTSAARGKRDSTITW